ncbi:ice-binding family protein [Micromonospora sp. NPDC049799]|uniref:ice-binding family protein n=1 Tax=Micromonospora sp. NPDC049799 TaxID=3154741 RepID=UPI0033FF87DC
MDGTLTLDAQGDAEAVFIFQVGSDLSTAAMTVAGPEAASTPDASAGAGGE